MLPAGLEPANPARMADAKSAAFTSFAKEAPPAHLTVCGFFHAFCFLT